MDEDGCYLARGESRRYRTRRKWPRTGGSSGGGGGSILFTMPLLETSGSSQAANFFPQTKHVEFKQADIPAGHYPLFKISSTTLTVDSWNYTYWPDGSLMGCDIMPYITSGCSGNGTINVDVYDGGSAPGTGAFTNSDITSNTDFKVTATGQKNITGSLTASANTGISDGDVTVINDGAISRYVSVFQEFNNGSDSTQAGFWFYIMMLKASGAHYGTRVMGVGHNAWHDVATPNHVVLSAVAFKDGVSTIRSIASTFSTFTFTWSSGSIFTCASTAALVDRLPVYLTTNNTLPTGLSGSTAYFIRVLSGTTFALHSIMSDVDFAANAVSASGAGTGTHTVNPTPIIQSYTPGPFTCGSTNLPDFIAGAGGGAECTVIWQDSKTYLESTKLYGPIDLTVSADAITARSYGIDTLQDFASLEGTGGERQEIGWKSAYALRHFLRQDKDSLKTLRCLGLEHGQRMWRYRRSSTRNPINPTDTAYTNLGTKINDLIYYPSNHNADSASANKPTDISMLYQNSDYSHKPCPAADAYQVTGEQYYLDMLIDQAIGAAMANNNESTYTVSGGATYYNILLRNDAQRINAWTLRDVLWGLKYTPTTWRGSNIRALFLKILTDNFDYLVAEKATGSAFAIANGFFPTPQTVYPNSGNLSSWQHSYQNTIWELYYTITQDADARTAVEDTLKFWDGIRTNQALFLLSSFYCKVLAGGVAASQAKNAAGWEDVVHSDSYDSNGTAWNLTTDKVTPLFLANGGTSLSNGDTIMFHVTTPGGLALDQVYRFLNVSSGAGNVEIAASPGAKNITNTASEGPNSFIYGGAHTGMSTTAMVVPPDTGSGNNSYRMMQNAVINWASALGFTVPSGLKSAVNTAVGAPSFADKPTYAMLGAFT